MGSWKRDFASGLIILVPLLVTIIVLAWIYSYLARVPIPVDSGPIRVVLALVIFVLLVFSVGYLMRTAAGAILETALDDLMNRLPGLRVVYNASKMAIETAFSGTQGLRTPVRLEVWDGIYMTAFKTGKRTSGGMELLFMPTAPNITTGFVIEVDPERYEEMNSSVEDAMTRLLSAGFGETNDESLSGVLGDQQSLASVHGSASNTGESQVGPETSSGDGEQPSDGGAKQHPSASNPTTDHPSGTPDTSGENS